MSEENNAASLPSGRRLGNWVILRKLDEGGFGQVYKVEHRMTKDLAAMKAEPNDVEGGSAIKLELAVLKALTADGPKPHIPNIIHAAKHKKFSYMIITLLGDNIKALKISCPHERMTPQTWSRIGIQCLYSVKLVHDYGYIHRDIKPNNFVMGHRFDQDRYRIVHILDFGLARSFAAKENGRWVPRKPRGTAEFRGTLRYCSPNVHEKKEQGRRDDVWSLMYVLLELHCGLPWQNEREKTKVETMKINLPDKALVQNFPAELHGVIPHLRALDYYQRPDYSLFHNGLLAIIQRLNVKLSEPYDWEKGHMQTAIRTGKPSPSWENSVEFFKSDPIGISSPAYMSDKSVKMDMIKTVTRED